MPGCPLKIRFYASGPVSPLSPWLKFIWEKSQPVRYLSGHTRVEAGSGKVGGPSGTGPAGSAAAASSMDFEFDTNDEIAPSGTPLAKLNKDNKELRGSARKKTSDLNSILSNMQRHKIADQMATGAPVAKPPSHS